MIQWHMNENLTLLLSYSILPVSLRVNTDVSLVYAFPIFYLFTCIYRYLGKYIILIYRLVLDTYWHVRN